MKHFSKIRLLAVLLISVPFPVLFTHGQNFSELQTNVATVMYNRADWADFDQDGDLDIAAAWELSPGNHQIVVYRNDGGGSFTSFTIGSSTAVPRAIGWVDYDGDRDLDIYLEGQIPSTTIGLLQILRNDGAFVFTQVSHNIPYQAGVSKWADLDNDGVVEFLNRSQSGTGIYRHSGNGNFQALPNNLPSIDFSNTTSIGDYDLDGDLDILANVFTAGGTAILRNDSNLNFTQLSLPFGYNTGLKLGDYDADGDLDLAVIGVSGGGLYRNDAGNFVALSNPVYWSPTEGFGDWGDYDNDGDLDFLVGGSVNIIMYYLPPVLDVFRNDGNNSFSRQPVTTNGVFDYLGQIEWGDYDGDGKLDILAAGSMSSGYDLKIYRNAGTSIFNRPPAIPTGLHAWMNADSSIVFRWNRAQDGVTTGPGHSYRLWISAGYGPPDLSPPLSDTITGMRWVAATGEIQDTTWYLKEYSPGTNLYARVQAIDQGLMGSAWSAAIMVSDTMPVDSLDAYVYADACQLVATGAGDADSLRWFQCNPWQMVPGANQAAFEPGNANAYAAILYQGNHADTTACTSIVASGSIDTTVQVQSCFTFALGASLSDSLRWIDCNTLLPVPGATNAVFYPPYPGDFRVVLYSCNARDSSACHNLQPTYYDSTVIVNSCGLISPGASAVDIDSVHWIDCATMQPIPGQTFPTFYPNSNGNYALVLYHCQISDTTMCAYWPPLPIDTTVTVNGSILSVNPGPAADSVKWIWCEGSSTNPPLPVTGNQLPAVLTGSYRAEIYHCNGVKSSGCHFVNAQFTALPANAFSMNGLNNASLDWGDYDQDDDLDLLVTGNDNSQNEYAELFQNNGNGTFSAISTPLVPVDLADAAWGDYDGDGDVDILMAGWERNFNRALTRIYRNDGGGTFTDIQAGLDTVAQPSTSWADYDGDGDLDALICGSNPPRCNLYRNDGNGQFSLQPAGFTGVYTLSADWGDFDNDGDLDLVYSGIASAVVNSVTRLYRNDGNGVFVSVPNNFPAVHSGTTAWVDYDSDGYLDLFICGMSATNQLFANLYHNNAGGSFSLVPAGIMPVSDCQADWGDIDNDGDPDLVIAGGGDGNGGPGTSNVRIYENLGNGNFNSIISWPSRFILSALELGDYDHDGDLDIVIAGSTFEGLKTQIFRNDSVPAPNLKPLAPQTLNATLNANGGIDLSWSPGSDATTATLGLSYQLMVGITPTGEEVVSSMTNHPGGWRQVPERGALQTTAWTLKDVQMGQSYFARVITVDAGKRASEPSEIGMVLGLDHQGDRLLLQAGPVPTRDFLQVILPATNGGSWLELLDMQGKVLISQKVPGAGMTQEMQLDLGGFAAGTYLLRWMGQETTLSLRVVKE